MSVPANNSLQQYTIASLGQSFTPGIYIQNTTDLVVTASNLTTGVDTTLLLNIDYTVTGSFTDGVNQNPLVTLEATGLHYAVGNQLTIWRNPGQTQPTTISNGAPSPAATYNNAWDWIVYQMQALNDRIARVPSLPSSAPVQASFSLSQRASKGLGFDANGNFSLLANPNGSNPWSNVGVPLVPYFFANVTAKTGNTVSTIDGIPTANVAIPQLGLFVINTSLSTWILKASNANTNAGIIQPATNANLRWVQVG